MWKRLFSKKKETEKATKLVTKLSRNVIDDKTILIKAESEWGFWQQQNYHELLLAPPMDECWEAFDIAELIVKTKADRHNKKFHRQAASILHERRCQWQLYEVEIYSARRVELRYFNYRTENRGTITLDLTRRPRARFCINNTVEDIRYRVACIVGENSDDISFNV